MVATLAYTVTSMGDDTDIGDNKEMGRWEVGVNTAQRGFALRVSLSCQSNQTLFTIKRLKQSRFSVFSHLIPIKVSSIHTDKDTWW